MRKLRLSTAPIAFWYHNTAGPHAGGRVPRNLVTARFYQNLETWKERLSRRFERENKKAPTITIGMMPLSCRCPGVAQRMANNLRKWQKMEERKSRRREAAKWNKTWAEIRRKKASGQKKQLAKNRAEMRRHKSEEARLNKQVTQQARHAGRGN
ncbi:hypothetical protein FZEAL_7745 [Fusarium zealandicum]|uniref:Uncharacterized protein n=1 Tax=Fusarium zealandicum TaxID=1053134 RepID=A0A8H4UFH4_9HYPO|nr:hypothetical protein FZEAL_7745 [Fusarium zealandicum]